MYAEKRRRPEAAAEQATETLGRDLGKVAIPDSILHKPGPLTPEEAHLLRHDTAIGYRILHAAPPLRPVADIVRRVGERWDGRGYPR